MQDGKFNLHDSCDVPNFSISGRLSSTFEENNIRSIRTFYGINLSK